MAIFFRLTPLKLFLSALWLTLMSLCATADQASGNTDAEQLHRLLAELDNLSGAFTQTLSDKDGDTLQQSQGQFAMKRPGKFRWHTQLPFEQLLVSDQETLWLYDPDLEQVTVRPFDQRLQQTPALLLNGGLAQLRANYTISRLDSAEHQAYQLLPIAEEPLFKALYLTFTEGQLTEMKLLDSLGQETQFLLSELQVNIALDEQQFHFTPPPGTDVLIDDAH